jgi:hypothetical protein
MLERIDQYCRNTIAAYEQPELDPEKQVELKRIFRAAERQILGAQVTEI